MKKTDDGEEMYDGEKVNLITFGQSGLLIKTHTRVSKLDLNGKLASDISEKYS